MDRLLRFVRPDEPTLGNLVVPQQGFEPWTLCLMGQHSTTAPRLVQSMKCGLGALSSVSGATALALIYPFVLPKQDCSVIGKQWDAVMSNEE